MDRLVRQLQRGARFREFRDGASVGLPALASPLQLLVRSKKSDRCLQRGRFQISSLADNNPAPNAVLYSTKERLIGA